MDVNECASSVAVYTPDGRRLSLDFDWYSYGNWHAVVQQIRDAVRAINNHPAVIQALRDWEEASRVGIIYQQRPDGNPSHRARKLIAGLEAATVQALARFAVNP